MTDYAEERRSELEVLESIFPDELTIISEHSLSIRVEPEVQRPSEPYVLLLKITYSPTYPDELPEIGVECEEGELSEEEEEHLVMELIAAANDSIGMAMVYTLSLALRDSLAELLKVRKARIAAEELEKARIEDEIIALRTAGTKVTAVSFAEWNTRFESELKERKRKEQRDRLAALPLKEREEVKRVLAKPTGRQLFEADASLINSDAGFEEDGATAVDISHYARAGDADREDDDDADDDAPLRAGLGDLNLSDSD